MGCLEEILNLSARQLMHWSNYPHRAYDVNAIFEPNPPYGSKKWCLLWLETFRHISYLMIDRMIERLADGIE